MWVNSKWVKVQITKQCVHCETAFETSDKRKLFCSPQCKNTHNSNKYRENHLGELRYYLSTLVKIKSRADLTVDQLELLYEKQQGLCAITKVPMTFTQGSGKQLTNISIDRIIPGSEYTIENIQLVCYIVNTMKSNLSTDDLVLWAERIVNESNRCRN